MKAIVQTEYGSPDVLKLADVDRPVMPDDGVLVRVRAASVNAGDWHLMRGSPFLARLMFGGLWKPKIKILGFDVAGIVEAVGEKVTGLQVGSEVFGDLSECGFGAFAEYVCASADAFILKPAQLSFEEAAAVPGAAIPALQALRDIGQVQPGQKVLVNGAAGGVGSFVVQIAKAFGAEVSAICSSQKMDRVKAFGADHVIDYTKTDAAKTTQLYDLIIDAAAYRSVFDYLPALKPKGTYVLVGGATARLFQVMLLGPLISKMSDRTIKCLVSKPNQADLATLREIIVNGNIVPHIDHCYSLNEVPAAIRRLEQRQVVGKVVIRI